MKSGNAEFHPFSTFWFFADKPDTRFPAWHINCLFAPASVVQENITLVIGLSVFKWKALSAWRMQAYVGFPVMILLFNSSNVTEEAIALLVSQ